MTDILPTTIYMVRHGETEWNIRGVLQGQKDAALTPRGVQQAHDIANKFEKIHFDAIYSSDLGRAQTTAHIIAESRNMIVHVNSLLRERDFGQYQGRKATEVLEELKDRLHMAKSLPHQERAQFKLSPDIESDKEMIDRTLRFLIDTVALHPSQTLLVATHAGIIKNMLIHFGFGTYHDLSRHSIDNLGYIVLEVSGGMFTIKETFGVHKDIAGSPDEI